MKNKVSGFFKGFFRGQQRGAYEATLEDLFQDYYAQRRRVYKMNFIRGIFFGLGSVLGGTIVVAIIIWTLSFFVNFPVIGELLKNAEQNLKTHQTK